MANFSPTTSGAQPPAKRRKLTAAEKEEKRKEKEEHERQKAEQVMLGPIYRMRTYADHLTMQKAQREELKRLKEEEKRLKEEERRKRDREREEEKQKRDREREEKKSLKEEERRQKEEEKRQKEEEKRRKEEEQNKKDKVRVTCSLSNSHHLTHCNQSQMRLNAFFTKPTISPSKAKAATTESSRNGSDVPYSSRGRDIAELETEDAVAKAATDSAKSLSDYERTFPPFFVQSYVSLASHNRYGSDSQELIDIQTRMDECLAPYIKPEEDRTHRKAFNLESRPKLSNRRRQRGRRPLHTVKHIIGRIQGSVGNPIDLTCNARNAQSGLRDSDLLNEVPVKFLKFAEDVRPPYRGTFSRRPPDQSSLRKGRNPFERSLPAMNYDYDSEAEWEEPDPEDGEDLDSEGEEDAGTDEEGDDMDGFLDDEDMPDGPGGARNRRRVTSGDLEPLCTGLCWEGAYGQNHYIRTEEKALPRLDSYRLEVILGQSSHHGVHVSTLLTIISEGANAPIDPYSTSYWQRSQHNSPSGPKAGTTASGSMNPPRAPLHTIDKSNAASNQSPLLFNPNGKAANVLRHDKTSSKTGHANKRLVRQEDMEDFQKAVDGSDLTKAGLIEVLKKRSVWVSSSCFYF